MTTLCQGNDRPALRAADVPGGVPGLSLSGMVVAALSAAVILSGSTIIGHVRKPVLGGPMLMLGLQILWRWVLDAARRISLRGELLLLAVAGIILKWGFLAGLVAGVTIACVVFAVSASQASAIKFSFDGGEFRSTSARSPGWILRRSPASRRSGAWRRRTVWR